MSATLTSRPACLVGLLFLTTLVLVAPAVSQAQTLDPSTGKGWQPVARARTSSPGGSFEFASIRPKILWVETQGHLRDYWSRGDYANIVNLMARKADLMVKGSGTITVAKLQPFDLVIVPLLANFRTPFTKAEYQGFLDYVDQGGCLYVWVDRPSLPHAVVDPLLQGAGLNRTGTETLTDLWECVLPGHSAEKAEGIVGGHVAGGTKWLDENGQSVADYIDYGQGRVYVLGDCNAYAQMWNAADNLRLLKWVAKDSLNH